jgi:hypothetical protein
MPSYELADYLNLQKEIKRLNEDNVHLISENKELIGKLKAFQTNQKDNLEEQSSLNESLELEGTVRALREEIFVRKRFNRKKNFIFGFSILNFKIIDLILNVEDHKK